MSLLSKTLMLRVRNINIGELNLSRNYLEHDPIDGIKDLETVIDTLNCPCDINLSNNKIREFTSSSVLAKKIVPNSCQPRPASTSPTISLPSSL
jgi:hypothetical protein